MPAGCAPGERRGRGRKGIPNKSTAEYRRRIAESGELPHEFLLRVARGEVMDENGQPPTLALRMKAAADCAPYFAPRMATVTHAGHDGGPLVVKIVRYGGADLGD
jgi:hypothetical protein